MFVFQQDACDATHSPGTSPTYTGTGKIESLLSPCVVANNPSYHAGSNRQSSKLHARFVLTLLRSERAASAQSFALWQQATIEITRCNHSFITCSCHIYIGVVLHALPVCGESHIQRNTTGEVATTSTGSRFVHHGK